MTARTVFVSSEVIRGGKLDGEPPTQGDHFADPRTGRIIDQKATRIRVWRRLIAAELQQARWQPIMHGPIRCTLDFVLPRPKSHYRGVRIVELRPDAPLWHQSKPDLDKLARAAFDALSKAGAWADDAQVCQLISTKRYTTTGQVGVRITCAPVDGEAVQL